MSDELISEYIDKPGFSSNTQFALAELNKLASMFEKLSEFRLNLDKSSGIGQATNISKQYNQVLEEAIGLQTRLNGHSKEAAQLALSNAKTKVQLAKVTVEDAKAETEALKTKRESLKLDQDKTKQTVNEKKASADLTNEYKQLILAYNEAALRAKNLQIQAAGLGANHPLSIIAKQATADANALGYQLKVLDASTGTFNRNVGNYGGALVEYGKKAFGFVRTAANILPGLGLSGAFLLIFEGFSKLISLIKGGTTELTKFAETQRTVKKAFEDGGYKEAVKNVSELTTYVKLAKQGFADKKDVLDEYNKRLGDTIGKAGSLDEAEKLLVKNGDAYIKVTLLKAAANIALGEAAQIAVDIAQDAATRDPLENTDLRRDAFKNSTKEEIQSYNKLREDANKAFFAGDKKRADELTKQADDLFSRKTEEGANVKKKKNKKVLEEIAASFQEDAAGLADKFGIDLFGNKDKAPKKEDNKAKEAADKELIEKNKQKVLELQRIADFNKEVADNENIGLLDRLSALRSYYDAKNKIFLLNAELEKNIGKKTAEEIRTIDRTLDDQQIRLEKEFGENKSKIIEDNREKFTKDEEKLQAGLEKAAKKAFDNFKKWEEERNKELEKNRKKREKDDEDYKNIRKKLEEDLVKELIDLSAVFFNANLERQKNAIQDQIDLLEKQKQKDIEVANQTIASAQDKAAAIAVIEARAAAQREQLEQRQRKISQEQARFDKAASIANIIAKTAEAILGFLAKPGGPQGVALSILAGAIGAAQLAKVVATPIPRYAEGTDDHPGGKAIVGDGGKSELAVTPDGRMYKTPSRPTLVDLPKHSIVLPDADLAFSMALMGTGRIANTFTSATAGVSMTEVTKEIKEMGKDIVRAIESKEEIHFHKPSLQDRLFKVREGNKLWLKMNGLGNDL